MSNLSALFTVVCRHARSSLNPGRPAEIACCLFRFGFLPKKFELSLKPQTILHQLTFAQKLLEETCLRFPHIIELISEQLDNHTLVKCKEAS